MRVWGRGRGEESESGMRTKGLGKALGRLEMRRDVKGIARLQVTYTSPLFSRLRNISYVAGISHILTSYVKSTRTTSSRYLV